MPNISQGELLIIAGIIAMLCFIAMTGILVLLIWWFKYKTNVASNQFKQAQTAEPVAKSEKDEKNEPDYSAFAPQRSPEKKEVNSTLKPEEPIPFSPQTTIDLEQPPLSDHPQENDSAEPMTSQSEQQKSKETDVNDGEIGAEDATVLMQRPPRPEES